MKDIRVYISGAITGTDDYKERFSTAEVYVNAHKGCTAINPVKLTADMPPETTKWEEYMGEALKLLASADAVYFMKDWKNSRGACIEHEVAIRMGKDTYFEKEDSSHLPILEYETLGEQGRLLKLPCKIGDTLWCIDEGELIEYEVKEFVIRAYRFDRIEIYFRNSNGFCVCDFNANLDEGWFLTKEQAEKALREGVDDGV